MNKRIIIAILVATGAAWAITSARVRVDLAALFRDPDSMKLSTTYPPLIQGTVSSRGVQTGLVTLPDGEKVKFWFISHHLVRPGYARFDFSDGTTKYMKGDYFCCEVQIPREGIETRKDLIAFIHKHDEP